MTTVIFVVVWFLLCLIVGKAAENKGRSFAGWAFLAVFTSPLIAGLILLVVGNARDHVPENRAQNAPASATQIKELAELRDTGVLTPQEFEAKKADLLARL
jgi:NADH:ubiquinone oxidoreductase subunit 6 (subunit J)